MILWLSSNEAWYLCFRQHFFNYQVLGLSSSWFSVHICYENTLFSITFEPLVRFWCFNLGFEALNVYFMIEVSIIYLVGHLFLESAEKRTELSKKCGLIYAFTSCTLPENNSVDISSWSGWIYSKKLCYFHPGEEVLEFFLISTEYKRTFWFGW